MWWWWTRWPPWCRRPNSKARWASRRWVCRRGCPTVTLHASLAPGSRHGEVIAAIHDRLEERLRVEHTTVQIEEEGDCETPGCGP